ncbi:MAG: UDP-N-acetylglucosamine 1-carboxyvinyltransferase [bacterium]
MEKFVIEGGYPLKGRVTPSGNKNAAAPILAATLLTDEEVVIENVPRIDDIKTMIEIMTDLGVDVKWTGKNKLAVRAKEIGKSSLSPELCRKVRTSLLFAGPMLARLGKVSLPPPGGDVIGRRRIDTHLAALQSLGAEISVDRRYDMRAPSGLRGRGIFLDEASVTATENAIMAAVLARGTTVIENAAMEPHVQELARFLNELGAKISGIGTNTLTIEGVDGLKGGKHTVEPDYMEIGSFIGLGAVTRGEITIENTIPSHLKMILLVFEKLGVKVEIRGNDIIVPPNQKMEIVSDAHDMIPTIYDGPWPAFSPDLMSIALVTATQARGTILIFEKMYESRMYFVDKLINMGAKIVLCDPHRAVVVGPSKLHGDDLISPDIRAGMAILIASLCAEGTSTISNIDQIDRGYEKIEEKLQALGAKIRRVSV